MHAYNQSLTYNTETNRWKKNREQKTYNILRSQLNLYLAGR
jgi:hypothetical protein